MPLRTLKTNKNNTVGEKLSDFRLTITSLLDVVNKQQKEIEKLKQEISFLKIIR